MVKHRVIAMSEEIRGNAQRAEALPDDAQVVLRGIVTHVDEGWCRFVLNRDGTKISCSWNAQTEFIGISAGLLVEREVWIKGAFHSFVFDASSIVHGE